MNNSSKSNSFTQINEDFEKAKYNMDFFCWQNDIKLDKNIVQEIEVKASNISRKWEKLYSNLFKRIWSIWLDFCVSATSDKKTENIIADQSGTAYFDICHSNMFA